MNLIKSLLVAASLMVAATATAQNTTTDKRDSLPADAIIVRRVPLESKPSLQSKEDILVVDTIPSSSDGLSIVLYNDNTWQYIRNRNIDVLDETIYTENWNDKIQPYDIEQKDLPAFEALMKQHIERSKECCLAALAARRQNRDAND